MKTVLITGGAGFIGSHIANACIAHGYRVVILDNLSHGTRDNLPSSILPPSLRGGRGGVFYHGDIRDEGILCEIREKENPLIVIHCAAQISVPRSIEDPEETFAINSHAVERLAAILKPLKIIFSSSGGAVYGDPTVFPTPEHHHLSPLSPYGESKKRGEEILKLYHERYPRTAVIILRYANVYGERQPAQGGGVVAILCKKAISGEKFILNGNGNQTRDFVHVSDVVQANIHALAHGYGCECLNIGTGREISLNELIDMMNSVKTGENLPSLQVTEDSAQPEVTRSALDISHARKWGWEPKIGLEEGLRRTWEWWNKERPPLLDKEREG